MNIYCCGCRAYVSARRTTGKDIYPHRTDLQSRLFWRCDQCGNWVGCHRKGQNPLGCIPTPEIRRARMFIHNLLDPLWKNGPLRRTDVYRMISDEIGREYHTAEIRTLEEARDIYRIVRRISLKTAKGRPGRATLDVAFGTR